MIWKMSLLAAMLAMLAGCPVTQPQGTPVSERHEVDEGTGRSYYIYVPTTYHRSRPVPLIITCHGTNPYDTADMHIREWKMIGQNLNAIVVAPVLTATDGIFGDGPPNGMLSDERYIMSLISELGYHYNIDMANIMITGFSGGGFPAYWVGLRHPDVFSVIAARNCNFNQHNTAGWFPPEATSIRMFIYYGENDPGPIRDQSMTAIKFLRASGFTVETIEIPRAGHVRHPEYALDFFIKNRRPPRPSLPSETK